MLQEKHNSLASKLFSRITLTTKRGGKGEREEGKDSFELT
jgi:hypothetical protein